MGETLNRNFVVKDRLRSLLFPDFGSGIDFASQNPHVRLILGPIVWDFQFQRPSFAFDIPHADELVFGEYHIPRYLEFFRSGVVDTVYISGFISNQKTHHGLLVQLLSARLVNMTIDLASPLSNVPNRWFLTSPGFVGCFIIDGVRWEPISNVARYKDGFPP